MENETKKMTLTQKIHYNYNCEYLLAFVVDLIYFLFCLAILILFFFLIFFLHQEENMLFLTLIYFYFNLLIYIDISYEYNNFI